MHLKEPARGTYCTVYTYSIVLPIEIFQKKKNIKILNCHKTETITGIQ